MKNSGLIVFVVCVCSFFIQGCDYVQNANQNVTPTTQQQGNVVYRKILVEDYTGHKCGNCPAAARQLNVLEGVYGAQIVPMAVHAGFYAVVNPASSPPYPTDLKSQASTDYDNTFGNSTFGNPNGLVNRVGFGSANFIEQWSGWSTTVSSMVNTPADFQIKIVNTFNIGSNQVTTKVTSTALTGKTGTYNLIVLMTEDSIVGEQLDYSMPPSQQYITNYVFNHVLRGAINSSWGDQIFNGTVNKNDSIVKSYPNFQLSANWKAKNCYVVAFIYDALTSSTKRYEVVQVENKKVM